MAENANQNNDQRVLTNTKIGVVTSDARDKTRTVTVAYQVRHPKYGKFLKRSTKFQVHDPGNDSVKGDRVEIVECRPVSKTKAFRLVRVLERGNKAVEEAAAS